MTIGALSNIAEQLLLVNLFPSAETSPTVTSPGRTAPVTDLRLGLWSASPTENVTYSPVERNTAEDDRHLTRFGDQSGSKPVAAPMTFTTPTNGTATNAADVTITIPAGGTVTHIAVEGLLPGTTGTTVVLYAELTTSNGTPAPVVVPAGGTFRLPAGALTIRLDDGTSAMAMSDWAELAALNWLLKGNTFPIVTSHSVRLLTAANPESVANPSGYSQDRTADPESGNPDWLGHSTSTVYNSAALTFSAIPANTVLTHISIVADVAGAESASPAFPTNIFSSSTTGANRAPVIVGSPTTALDTNDAETSYALLPKSPVLATNTISAIEAPMDPVTTIPAGAVITKVTAKFVARLSGAVTGISNLHVAVNNINLTPFTKVVPITSTSYTEYAVEVPVSQTQAAVRAAVEGGDITVALTSADADNGTVLNDIRITQAWVDITYVNTSAQALVNGALGSQVTVSTGATVSLTPGAVQITLN